VAIWNRRQLKGTGFRSDASGHERCKPAISLSINIGQQSLIGVRADLVDPLLVHTCGVMVADQLLHTAGAQSAGDTSSNMFLSVLCSSRWRPSAAPARHRSWNGFSARHVPLEYSKNLSMDPLCDSVGVFDTRCEVLCPMPGAAGKKAIQNFKKRMFVSVLGESPSGADRIIRSVQEQLASVTVDRLLTIPSELVFCLTLIRTRGM